MADEGIAGKHCEPCRGGIPPLSLSKAKELLAGTPGWILSEDGTRISRTFSFEDFKEAMGFVNKVAGEAESEGHHPDIAIHWNTVDLVLYTHKINGLHENDFIMAARFNALV